MTRTHLQLLSAALLVGAVGCGETTSSRLQNTALAAAFATLPVGYDQSQNSFNASSGTSDGTWMPPGADHEHDRGPGGPFLCGLGGLMGGGIGLDFLGGPFFGHEFGHGRFGDPTLSNSTCVFSSSTGRVTCDPITRNGITVTRSAAFTDASGAVQQAFDSLTTNTIDTQISISGTFTRRDSSSSTLSGSSDRTISGLAKGSTQRTVNGKSAGKESTTGVNRDGVSFTADRVVGDTVTGVVIPVSSTGATYPTAGTVVRSMTVVLTLAGQSPQTSVRREVLTYDGSATAKVVITHDGETRTCSLPLPFGRPSCQ